MKVILLTVLVCLLLTIFTFTKAEQDTSNQGPIITGMCNYQTPHPTGSPCPNGYVKWQETTKGSVLYGHDIASKAGLNEETCRQFCWTFPGCASADLHKSGICYLNSQTTPVSVDSNFDMLHFSCCKQNETQQCQSPPSNTGGSGPCFSGSAKFLEAVPGKYIAGHDLKVLNGQTVESCRSACWETAGCRSADITNTGICYLNSLSGPTTASSPYFSFIGFECCPGAEPRCEKKPLSPTGSPCASGNVKWADPKQDRCVLGNDIFSKGGMTVNSCRDLCWLYPGCVSADLTTSGVCFLNSVTAPVSQCLEYSLLDFQCCADEIGSKCETKDLTPTGSPCPSGGISWKAIRPTEYVPGHDIISKAGMTVESCRDFCWSYPGCVSADITNAGVCYLNYAKTPTAKSPIFSLLEFECCNERPEPKCTFLKSQAGNSGPCFSSTAKFVDYKPGKYVAGNDLKVTYDQTVESCRQLCWNTSQCKSADITQAGVCYLNSVREPLSSSPHFSFIDFECCDPAEPQCQDKTVLPTGGPCPSGRIKWANPKENSCIWGHDIASKGGMNIDSCRDFCWTTPGCVSADLHSSGICFLNFVTTPVSNCNGYTFLTFECCPGPPPTCEKKNQTSTGSPCPSGHVIWKEPRAAMVVLGHDIASKAGMTIETCRDFCWSYPGCASADLTSAGVCYLNSVTGPISKHSLFSLLEFECCNPNAEAACVNPPSAAGSSGPCYSGSAKFLDYQPGKVIFGNDLKVAYGQTVESCRSLCWDTPNCKSADLTYAGVCYLNNVRGPVGTSPLFSLIDFECCSKITTPCQQRKISPTGSPCPNGYIRWEEPKMTYYVPGHDIVSKGGMTIDTCQDWCWTYPGCVSADFINAGVCYLNYASGPTAISEAFTLLQFECCKVDEPHTCKRLESNAGGSGPCNSGIAKFPPYQPGKYVSGYDIKVAYGQTVDTCRQLCWDTPWCKSADITNAGVCYLNSVKRPLSTSGIFSYIGFDCCEGAPPTCRKQTVAPTGSPCPKGYVRWMEPKVNYYVPGYDLASSAGMTRDTCRDYCWSYPGCVSADLTINGVCYLNYRSVPVVYSTEFMLLEFECCAEPTAPLQPITTTATCTVPPTQPPCTEDTKVDITFVLDGSGSIGAENYQKGLKTAVKGIIDFMLPGRGDTPSNSRVAAIVYSDKSVVQWNLDKYKTKNELFTAVDNLPYYASTTATGDALHDVLTQVHPKVRIGVKHLVILITDGESNDGVHTDIEEAKKLKLGGAIVFAIGVGSSIKKDVLDNISSGPEYRADVSSYNDLVEKMKKLAIITCKEAAAEGK